MKTILVREQSILNTSINFDGTEYNYFHNPLHYHPEFELTLIVKSFGQRRIGDSIENFNEGDLVLVGNNLPHVWKNDEVFLSEKNNLKAQAIAVKFLPDFASLGFLDRPEMLQIKNLLEEKAPLGIKLTGNLRTQVEEIMLKLLKMDETDRFIQLLQILNLISKSNEYKLLASLNYRNENRKNTHRINIVLDYIMEHYDEELTLEKVADKVSMNKNAFCRFFKKGTRKSLFTVINEVKIGKACQLLTETELNILQICYASGFNNISNFNKVFKNLTNNSPSEYRKKMRKFE
ncbi:MAG: AraC family transcriptional regulator [Bacteroidetes bacterium]|nr:AraC family transcriptional regulator [Bacteroidota bacterium]